jgi:hypothetical protein
MIERQYPGRQHVILGIEEGCGNREHPRQPCRGPDVRGVLAAFVLIDSGARGKGIYACLDAELPLRAWTLSGSSSAATVAARNR